MMKQPKHMKHKPGISQVTQTAPKGLFLSFSRYPNLVPRLSSPLPRLLDVKI
jgi:hypothetical protein